MTLRIVLVPALLALAVALPIRALEESAEAPAFEADKAQPAVASAHLQAAKRLYQKFDLEAAMAELREAESAAKLKDNEDELVLVLMYKGLIFADQGKASDMSDHFKRALAMRPWMEMPPETSPRIAKQFAEARRDLWGSPLKPPPRKKHVAVAPAPAQEPSGIVVPKPLTVPAPSAPQVFKVPEAPQPEPAAPAVEGLEPPK